MQRFFFGITLSCFLIITNIKTGTAQTWDWAKSGDGPGESISYATCTDKDGNDYVTGIFGGQLIVFGSYTLSNTGNYNAFIVKYDPQGNVLWARCSEGTFGNGTGVSTDNAGNVYITGSYRGNTVKFGTYTVTNTFSNTIYVTKYDSQGDVIWVKIAGGAASNVPNSSNCVKTDLNGNVFLTGMFGSPTLNFDANHILNLGNVSNQVFLVKYDSNGNVLWTKGPTGSSGESNSIATDSNGNVYIVGDFIGASLTFDALTLTNTSAVTCVFLAKYDVNGNIIWAKQSVNSQDDLGQAVAVDLNSNVYITGYFTGPTIGFDSFTLNQQANFNMFVVKYDVNGNAIWAKGNNAFAYSIATDANGVYVSGGYNSTIYFGTYTLNTVSGNQDAMFIANYDLNGNEMYATNLLHGGSFKNSICLDKNCNVYSSGSFNGLPSTFSIGTTTLSQTGIQNVFTAKLSFDCVTQGISELSNNIYESLIFPNPNIGIFKIKIDPPITNGKLILTDQLGQEIYAKNIEPGDNNVITHELSSGLYHYIISQNNQTIGSGILVIQKD